MENLIKLRRIYTANQNTLQAILLLVIRLWIANIFLKSGLLKLQSWEATLSLFTDDYNLPLMSPQIAAVLATIAEIGAGGLILFGFFTPFAALLLFMVTLTIELFVFPGTNDHYHWMMLCGVLFAFGGGKLSIDALIFKKARL